MSRIDEAAFAKVAAEQRSTPWSNGEAMIRAALERYLELAADEPEPVIESQSDEWIYARCKDRGTHNERHGACVECGFDASDFPAPA